MFMSVNLDVTCLEEGPHSNFSAGTELNFIFIQGEDFKGGGGALSLLSPPF